MITKATMKIREYTIDLQRTDAAGNTDENYGMAGCGPKDFTRIWLAKQSCGSIDILMTDDEARAFARQIFNMLPKKKTGGS